MEQLVNELIKFFLEEASHPVIDIPTNYVNKREFLRGLMNVREAKGLPPEIIEKENELLKLELEQKDIVDIDTIEDKFSLYQGDITNVKCDAIVNPSNNKLLGCFKPNHNCVSNKIHTYAGVSLRLKCKEITKGAEIETCKVILTDGYNLPCKQIIHAVKPEFDEITDENLELVEKFYTNVFELAINNNIRTICVPNINVSSDLKEEVARVTIDTVKRYTVDDSFDKILFNVFTLDDYNIYSEYFEK